MVFPLNAIIIILKNNTQFITDKVLDNLSIGLSYLIEETKIYEKDTDKEIHEKLSIKISISRLIILLKRFYLESKRLDLPHYVTKWENLCLDINEFSEIRNIWINGKINHH
ncbi:hypothetical protein EZS27_020113 [termite gut metagenome]|uniref:Uncharacterized protein n=1 Tax=termite gut metagenome TaxID=433724 RepID=A0A5J4RBS0_9ZZZZ